VIFGEAHKGEDIGFGLVHQRCQFGDLRSELIGNLAPLQAGHFGILLGKGGGDEGGNDAPALLAGMRQDIAHEMHAATLPRGVQYFGNGRLEPLMRVRDHQLDAPEAAPCQRAQKLGPESLGLGGADGDAQHLASAIAVDGDGNDHRDGDDATGGANLEVGRIQPEIGPVAFQRPVKEGGDLVVDLAAQAADLALGDAGHAHGFDQFVDRTGRHALDISLLNNRGERLLGHPARFQKGREIAALAQLRDAQLDRAGAGLPHPVAIAVAVIDALRAAFPMRGAGQILDFQLHQALRGKPHHLAQ
jgi:hypothetical protein